MLTPDILRRLWPRAPQAKIDAIVRASPRIFADYGIVSPLRVAHLMAQISHENGAGTIIRENMNYSAPRLLQIFGQGHHSAAITPDEAQALAHHPQEISERVYGLGNPRKAKELGNTNPGDGYRFRGNGDLQLTGGASHRKIGQAIGVDLYGDPAQLEDPEISFRCAAAEFKALNCLPAADADNATLVTRRVNGGTNGLAERKAWLKRWKQALPELPDALPADDEAEQTPRAADETHPPRSPLDSKEIAAGVTAAATTAATHGGEAAAPAAGALDQARQVQEQLQTFGLWDSVTGFISHHTSEIGVVVVGGLVLFMVARRFLRLRIDHV